MGISGMNTGVSQAGQPLFGASKKTKVLRDGGGGYAWSYDDVVLLGGARTPFGKNGGSLSQVSSAKLLETAMQGTMDKVGIDPEDVDNTLVGNIIANDPHGAFLHKQVANDLGIPNGTVASQVNRLCGTGFELLRTAADYLTDGGDGVILTGGVENMSRTPWIDDQYMPDAMALGAAAKALKDGIGKEYYETLKAAKKGNLMAIARLPKLALAARKAQQELKAKQKSVLGSRKPPRDYNPLNEGLTDPHVGMVMYQTADELAARMGITRAEIDAFGAESQRRAAEAQKAGRFNEEIVPVLLDDGRAIDKDEHIRAGTTADKLGKLGVLDRNREDAIHTAGTSSGVVDGAAALAVSTGAFAHEKSLPVLAKLKSVAVTGCDPHIMGFGPVRAAEAALEAAGLSLDDMAIVEVNEAFAGQTLAVAKALSKDTGSDYNALLEKLNPDGGAIALGHPLSATGTRITLHTAEQLHKTGQRYALVSACIGGGQGIAAVIENPFFNGYPDDRNCWLPGDTDIQLPPPDAEVQ